MRSYYIFKSGRLRRKENTVFLEYEEDNKRNRKVIPIEDIDQIFVFGSVNLNTRFLEFVGRYEIPIHFFGYEGYYIGTYYPRERAVSGYVLVRQVEYYKDIEKRLNIARKIVEAALHNIRRNLTKKGYEDIAEKVKEYEENLRDAKSVIDIMSLEAHARKTYYSVWEEITGWPFGGREMHPPSNHLNALISFGNALMYSNVLKEIYRTPLSPAISYLHEPSEKRFSLALDIAEIFKPVLVDKLIFRLVDLKMLSMEKHFVSGSSGTFLNENGRKIFVQAFDENLVKTVLHRTLKRKVRYRELIRLDIYKLLKHIVEGTNYKPLKVWW